MEKIDPSATTPNMENALSINMKDLPDESELPKKDTEELSEDDWETLRKELEITEISATLEKTRKKNINILNSILSEYFDSYIIAGYTAENDEVIVHKITSSKDARAISSLLDDISIDRYVSKEDLYEDDE